MVGLLGEPPAGFVMSRFDRAVLRTLTERVDDAPSIGGMTVRVNPLMPEGLVAVVDRHGNLLYVLNLRGDHDTRTPRSGLTSALPSRHGQQHCTHRDAVPRRAEKIADAIRTVAERDKTAWETTSITTMDVAAVLRKPTADVEIALSTEGNAIWGCLPRGWTFGLRGATGIVVTRLRR